MSIRPSGESTDYRRGYEDGCAATRGHHDEAAKLRALAKQASPSFRALTDELANTPADAVREALYGERDVIALADLYARHVMAMTREGLHDKADIAIELAYRDSVIAALTARVAELESECQTRLEDYATLTEVFRADEAKYRQRAEQAEAQAEAHARDAARLDWLLSKAARNYRVQGSDANGWAVLDCSNGLTFLVQHAATSRDAIDQARAALATFAEGGAE